MNPTDPIATTEALLARSRELGKTLAHLGATLDPAQPPAEYERVRASFAQTNVALEAVNAELRGRLTVRQRALLAAALAELMRPLFVRWAVSTTRDLYQQIMDSLWQSVGSATVDASSFVSQIEDLPELQSDDPDRRDHQVGIALSFVAYALRIIDGAGAEMEDLDTGVQDFMNGFAEAVGGEAYSPVPADLRAAALHVADDVDANVSAAEMRRLAAQASSPIQAGLDPVARAHGWSLDRASEATGEATEVRTTQRDPEDVDWNR